MIRDGRGTSLIVVVCERWVAIGYSAELRDLYNITPNCVLFLFFSLFFFFFCCLVKILGQNLRIFHIFLKIVLQFEILKCFGFDTLCFAVFLLINKMNINKFTLVFRWVSKNAWRNKQLVVVTIQCNTMFFILRGQIHD